MNKKKTLKTIILMIFSISVLIGFDQWTKLMAIRHLMGQDNIILFPNVLELQYLENCGAAFGMLQNQQWIFIIIAFAFVLFASYVFIKMPFTSKYYILHGLLALLTSGAIGNVIDRVTRGYVVDFIYFSLIDFPIFNVADIYVVVSCILGFLLIMFYYKDEDLDFLSKKGEQY